MKEILVGLFLIFIGSMNMIRNAVIYAGCSTLIGILAFIFCISAFGGWGLLSLIFILPFIRKGINSGKVDEAMDICSKYDLIKSRITKLTRPEEDGPLIMRDIPYELSLKFALDHGADAQSSINDNINENIHFMMNIYGTNYFVYFARHIDGSTYLCVDDADEADRLFRERLTR